MEQRSRIKRPRSTAPVLAVAACAALALVVFAAQPASAATVSVQSGGLVSGALCAVGSSCPAQPVDGYDYSSGGAVSGTLDYSTSTNTVDFSFTLTSNATFGGETLLAGSIFSASGINVTFTPGTHGAETIGLATPAVDGTTTNVQFSGGPALTLSQNDPLVSALSCSLTGAGNGSCSISLGSVNGSGAALQFVDSSSNVYNSYVSFTTSLVPVPLPAALPLLLTGLAGIGAMSRRRLTPA